MHAILMTDLHLVDPSKSSDAAAHAARIGAYLDLAADKAPGAEFCVLAGDLTDAGEIGAYEWLRHNLDTPPFPVMPFPVRASTSSDPLDLMRRRPGPLSMDC